MKDLTEALAKLGTIGVIVASVTANVVMYKQVKVLQQALQLTYVSGFEAGVGVAQEKAATTLPQRCTTWWFGNDKSTIKARHQQAKAAYCPK